MAYVDGFVLPLPKKNIETYRQIASKCGAMKEGTAETAEIEITFGRPVEGNPHSVEHINDRRSRMAHLPR